MIKSDGISDDTTLLLFLYFAMTNGPFKWNNFKALAPLNSVVFCEHDGYPKRRLVAFIPHPISDKKSSDKLENLLLLEK